MLVTVWLSIRWYADTGSSLVVVLCCACAGDNILFTSYAHFESPRSLFELAEKKAVKKFLEYISDNHITVVTKKMWKIPEPKL